MRITRTQLKRIIREEANKVLNESDHYDVAETILSQLGRRFPMMVGAKNFVAVDEKLGALQFKVGRGKHPDGFSVNAVKITLDYNDTYIVEVGYQRGASVNWKAREEGIYVDMLHDTFERMTGLNTSF